MRLETFANSIKLFAKKYKHAFILLYALIYLPWFAYLEKHVVSGYNIIHMDIDDKIPFVEIFVVPYFLWFIYITLPLFYFMVKDVKSYLKMCAFLFSGMTIFLIVSTIYPNGHELRPDVFESNNIFTQMITILYKTDTPTNLFPSIHVYNSIGTHIAIARSECFKENKAVKTGSFVLMVSIILSTVLIKQHSLFDVLTAFLMAASFYIIVYKNEYAMLGEKYKEYEEEYSKI